jgi:hypothetical protein
MLSCADFKAGTHHLPADSITLKISIAPNTTENPALAVPGPPEERLLVHRLVIRSLRYLACIALAALCTCPWTARADVFADGDQVMLQIGPYVYHRNNDTEHNSEPMLVGLEWESASRWEVGASFFKNSFSQPCGYIYGGRRWFLRSADDGFYVKLTAGPLYGYKEPYEDKIPVNDNGLGFAVIPAIGYQYKRANAQLVILGGAGLMLSLGYDFWK